MHRWPANQRILAGAPATLTASTFDQDGTLSDASEPVTVGVVSEATATVIRDPGQTTDNSGTGTYQLSVGVGSTEQMDRWVATWIDDDNHTVATTSIDVVGGYFASVEQIRTAEPSIHDTSTYSAAAVLAARQHAEQLVERVTHRSMVPRYGWARVQGYGAPTLRLPNPDLRRVRTARVYTSMTAYTELTSDELDAVPSSGAGIVTRADGALWPCCPILFEYEYGWDRPPADLLALFMRYVRSLLTAGNSGIPTRATSMIDANGGSFSLATPGRGIWVTAIPEFDEMLHAYTFDMPGIA